MDEHNNPAGNNRDSEQGNGNTGQRGIRESLPRAAQDENTTDAQQAPYSHPKPSIGVRLWRAMWRRRHWRELAGHSKANWAEKTTVIVTACLLGVAAIQAFIYWQQARIMRDSLEQNERSIILGSGQLSVAARSAKAAEDALGAANRSADEASDAKRHHQRCVGESPESICFPRQHR